MDDDDASKLDARRRRSSPRSLIYANGDLSSFEITMEREGGVRSVTLAQDDKGSRDRETHGGDADVSAANDAASHSSRCWLRS